MTPFPWTDLLIIIGLIVLNGVFAMSELAIVSAKTSRLQQAASKGSKGAATAISLASDPGKFLSTVQIGITLVGIISGAYSGASLGGPTGERLAMLGVPQQYAAEIGFASVIAITTYATLVIGELVPKQIALRAAVPISLVMARPMAILARVAAPLVWLLDASSGVLIRLLGVRPSGQSSVTAEELHMLFAEATRSGVIESEQHQMLQGVVRLAQRPVRELMTPRTEVDWIDADADAAAIRAAIDTSPHSLMPVAEGSADRVLGVVKVRDILTRLIAKEPIDLRALMVKTEVVPDQLDAVDALRVLQQAEIAMAMVHDEYGHLDGIVTPVDLLTALVGNFLSDQDGAEGPGVVEREDGSLLVSGSLSADVLADRLGLEYGDDREFGTAAGYALHVLKRLPGEGDYFTSGNDLQDFARGADGDGPPPVVQFLHAIASCEKPLIAAVNGPAIGVGLTMLLHCDLVYAARGATLSAPFVKLGLVPEAASSLLLPEAVGQAVANDIFMPGRALSADEALQFGLVARVFDDTELADGVGEIALHVANSAPNALRLTKSLIRHRGVEIAAQMEREGKLFSDQLGSPDFAESVAAMMQKRAPVYP